MIEEQKPTIGTFARTILLLVVLINQIYYVALGEGTIPSWVSEETYEMISTAATAWVSLMAWWKNNSFSDAAIAADKVKDELQKQADQLGL